MKILIIGCGSIGQRHIKNLVSLKLKNLLAFDIDEKKLAEVKNISPSILVSNNLNNLWRENPKVAFITVPTALHIKYAIEAAKRGCHLFIEKPLSHNKEKIETLIKIVKHKKLISFIGYNLRFNNCIIKIKSLLENEKIGKIICGRTHFGSYLPERHPCEDYRFGYGARKSLGGGVILDALSHHLDYLIFLFGKPKEVFCYSNKSSYLDINTEDNVEVLARFSGDEVISLHANFLQRPYKHTLELIGEHGTIFCDLIKNKLRYYDINTKKWIKYNSYKDINIIFIKEIKHLIKCIQENALPPVDIIIAKQELEILMKIKKSSSIKKWIRA